MPDYINWYCMEIRLRIVHHISEERVEIIVREIEGHLRESAQRLMEQNCLSSNEAEKAAVEAFGKPGRIAMGYLRESRPRIAGLRPLWVVLAGAFLATASWDFHWMSLGGYFDNFGATWENGLAGLVGFLGLILFGLGVRAGYRSYRLPVLGFGVAMSLGVLMLTSFWIVGSTFDHQGFSRLHLSRDARQAQASIATLDEFKGYLAQGAKAYVSAKSAQDLPSSIRFAAIIDRVSGLGPGELREQRFSPNELSPTGDYFFVPRSVMAMVDGRIWGMDTVQGFAKAKAEWANADKYAGDIDVERRKFEGLLASADEARSGRLFFFNPDVYRDPVCWTIVFMPLLLIVDGIVSGLVRRRPSWRGRALA